MTIPPLRSWADVEVFFGSLGVGDLANGLLGLATLAIFLFLLVILYAVLRTATGSRR